MFHCSFSSMHPSGVLLAQWPLRKSQERRVLGVQYSRVHFWWLGCGLERGRYPSHSHCNHCQPGFSRVSLDSTFDFNQYSEPMAGNLLCANRSWRYHCPSSLRKLQANSFTSPCGISDSNWSSQRCTDHLKESPKWSINNYCVQFFRMLCQCSSSRLHHHSYLCWVFRNPQGTSHRRAFQ